jgi:hypothetical protein
MKRLLTTNITADRGVPIPKQGLDYLQDSHKEAIDGIVKGLVSYSTNDLIILYGCSVTGSGPYALTAGAMYYNGEVYLVDANASITVAGGQTLVWSIANNDTTEVFTDGLNYNYYRNAKLVLSSGTSGSGIANYDAATVKRLSNNFNVNNLTIGGTITSTDLTSKLDLKANKAQGSWTDLSYITGWGNGGFTSENLKIRKNDLGMVTIRGVIVADGTKSSNYNISNILTSLLDTQYRPNHNVYYPTQYYINGSVGISTPIDIARIAITGGLSLWVKGTISDGDVIPVYLNYWVS